MTMTANDNDSQNGIPDSGNDGTQDQDKTGTGGNEQSGAEGTQSSNDDDPIIKAAIAAVAAVGEAALVGIGLATANIIQKIAVVGTTSNLEIKNTEGNESICVMDNDTSMDSNSVSGTENSGALAKDQVNGNDGTLDASTLDGKAVSTETNALENNAGAVKNQGGVLDTSSDAMRIN